MKALVRPARGLKGRISVPGDKSISHRSVMLGALGDGDTKVRGFLPGGDPLATVSVVRGLGIEVEQASPTELVVHGKGLHGLSEPEDVLNCVNSGTTARLMAGILAGQDFFSVLTGSPQLRRRPMGRIADPLRRMGADIDGRGQGGYLPLSIRGGHLRAIEYDQPVASAQVKSAILLAGLFADGETIVRQPGPSRDHTERMLKAMGVDVRTEGLVVRLSPPQGKLAPLEMTIPGDASSAAFPLVAAILVPGSEVVIENVGVNPTRTGLLDVLKAMGASFRLDGERESGGEPVADLTVEHSEMCAGFVSGDTVVRMIDEFPILAVAATQAIGTTEVRDAQELRVKETDRIAAVAEELGKMGAEIEELPDGFKVHGPSELHGAVVDSRGDHRLAMALTVAGLIASGETTVLGADCASDSFPGFFETLRALGADVELV